MSLLTPYQEGELPILLLPPMLKKSWCSFGAVGMDGMEIIEKMELGTPIYGYYTDLLSHI